MAIFKHPLGIDAPDYVSELERFVRERNITYLLAETSDEDRKKVLLGLLIESKARRAGLSEPR